MQRESNGLTDAGREICDALGTLLRGAVSSRLDYDPVDEEVGEASIRDMIAEHGFEPITEGLGRVVYRVPSIYHRHDSDLVVKFARPAAERMGDARNGVEQNQQEASLWESVQGTEYESAFAPVIATDDDGTFVVMPECDVEAAGDDELADVRDSLSDAAWKPEIGADEIGLLEGRPVVVDYGILNERW